MSKNNGCNGLANPNYSTEADVGTLPDDHDVTRIVQQLSIEPATYTCSETQTPLLHSKWKEVARKCFVEFLGDLLFVFLGSMSGVAESTGLLGGALCHGICIAVLIISLGHISGGHFNPAVTLGVAVSRNIHPFLAILYAISQLFGGFIGALFVRTAVNDYTYLRTAGGTVNFDPTHAYIGQAMITSVITSYFLVQTVLCTAVDTDSKVLAPLAIGFSIVVDALAAGQVSGASMNPARSFGSACVYSLFYHNSTNLEHPIITPGDVWAYHYLHWVGPFIGGTFAGISYKVILATETKRWNFK